jgi:hypothetical protein
MKTGDRVAMRVKTLGRDDEYSEYRVRGTLADPLYDNRGRIRVLWDDGTNPVYTFPESLILADRTHMEEL